MNDLSVITNNQTLTMSSREIAELTGKRHADVMRDIRNMLSSLNLDASEFESTYRDSRNRNLIEYNLPSHHSLCLVSGYSVQSRMKVVSRIDDINQVSAAIRDFEVPCDFPNMYIYAIRETETGRIKIGISRDPEQRLKQLQTGNSQSLELISCQEARNRYKDEELAHIDNKSHHIRGEWFGSSASIQSH